MSFSGMSIITSSSLAELSFFSNSCAVSETRQGEDDAPRGGDLTSHDTTRRRFEELNH